MSGLSFRTPFRVRPVGLDAEVEGEATQPLRLRAGQQGVFTRTTDGYAFMIASDSSRWSWPGEGEATSVMLFRAVPDHWVVREVRRLGDPQRRDALYKAQLAAPEPR